METTQESINMKKQAVVGYALAMIGAAAGSLLAPQAASALDFTFRFEEYYGGGVTGLIEGLSEGINACLSTDSCRITVTNNGGNGAPVGPSQTYLAIHVDEAAGFQVVTPAGANPYILQTSASWPPPLKGLIWYGSNNLFKLAFIPGYDQASNTYYTAGCLMYADTECGREANPYENQLNLATQFTYVSGSVPGGGTDVPGPLPVFGAATAFGYSRRLRRRIKKSGNSASSTYTL
jgi:hypothetical protein